MYITYPFLDIKHSFSRPIAEVQSSARLRGIRKIFSCIHTDYWLFPFLSVQIASSTRVLASFSASPVFLGRLMVSLLEILKFNGKVFLEVATFLHPGYISFYILPKFLQFPLWQLQHVKKTKHNTTTWIHLRHVGFLSFIKFKYLWPVRSFVF